MKLYSLSEVAERVWTLRETYESDLSDSLKPDLELESAMKKQKEALKKMKQCDAALEILEKFACQDLQESFRNIRNRIPNDLPF